MIEFLQRPIGSAIVGAVVVVIALAFFGSIGWIDQPELWVYALGAAAGFVGGWIGAGAMARNRQDQ